MIKYIVFDFDGTLVDSREIAYKVINILADKYNFKKVEEHEIEHLQKMSIMNRCKYLNIPVYKLPLWSADFYKLYKTSMNSLNLYNGMKELLKKIKALGLEIAVISSNSEENIRKYLLDNKVYIKQVLSSKNLFQKDKTIKTFLKKNKLDSSKIIYIGDEERDIIAAKKNNVKIIWVDWGFDIYEIVKDKQPDYMASTPDDIIRIIETIKEEERR